MNLINDMKVKIMNMSNIISKSRRHDFFNYFTPQQKRALDILQVATLQSRDYVYARKVLQFNQVNDSEILWLGKTGYFLPA